MAEVTLREAMITEVCINTACSQVWLGQTGFVLPCMSVSALVKEQGECLRCKGTGREQTVSVAWWLRRPPRERQTWVRIPLSPLGVLPGRVIPGT